jgi:hypothetical protein
MPTLKRFLPSSSDVINVYSIIVFWAYSWCLFVFVFNLPGWILKVPFSEILGYFSYGMIYVFFDTLLFLAIILLLSAILPVRWFRNNFVVSGALTATMLFFWVVFFQVNFNLLLESPENNNLLILLVAMVILILSLELARRLSLIQKVFSWFASACVVFVYVYGILTVIGFVVVIARNIS